MKEFIRFCDVNVDGCGTDVEVYVQIEGTTQLTNGVIERTKQKIEKYKEENDYEYDTDSVVEIACEYLETEGFKCSIINYSYCVEF